MKTDRDNQRVGLAILRDPAWQGVSVLVAVVLFAVGVLLEIADGVYLAKSPEVTSVARASDFQIPRVLESEVGDVADIESVYWYGITNKGERTATDILMQLPGRGWYEVQPSVGNVITGTFENRIQLPDLRSGDFMHVAIWSNYPQTYYSPGQFGLGLSRTVDNIRVTHSEGNIAVDYEHFVKDSSLRNMNRRLVLYGAAAIVLLVALALRWAVTKRQE